MHVGRRETRAGLPSAGSASWPRQVPSGGDPPALLVAVWEVGGSCGDVRVRELPLIPSRRLCCFCALEQRWTGLGRWWPPSVADTGPLPRQQPPLQSHACMPCKDRGRALGKTQRLDGHAGTALSFLLLLLPHFQAPAPSGPSSASLTMSQSGEEGERPGTYREGGLGSAQAEDGTTPPPQVPPSKAMKTRGPGQLENPEGSWCSPCHAPEEPRRAPRKAAFTSSPSSMRSCLAASFCPGQRWAPGERPVPPSARPPCSAPAKS
ncbi:Hypothetical predicted protein [Podarcis lilfordi]|uniref:Uncharacterized protein n=1 Tax=Podarcis lilfordi TaxID=74358 RepID=A0AA35K8G7_9SAUR|nr:Hypothetical predicted protein [Podarcis lilfordi]